MKSKLTIFLTAAFVAGSMAAIAAPTDQGTNPDGNTGVVKVKKGKRSHSTAAKKHKTTVAAKKTSSTASSNYRTAMLEGKVQQLENEVDTLKQIKQEARPAWIDYMYKHGPIIVTSPQVEMATKEDGSDLFINMMTPNEDLALLKTRQTIDTYLQNHNIVQDRPIIAFSGDIEGQMHYNRNYSGPTNTDINLSGVDLEVVSEINPWVSGLMIFSYDSSRPIDGPRVSNSNVYFNRAFLTFGNLNKFPLYMSIGQMYVPFGNFSNYMITDPVTQTLGKTKERALLLGLNTSGLYAAAYAYRGDSFTSNVASNMVNSWGANLGYSTKKDKFSGDIGASFINNIADSAGMQGIPPASQGDNPNFYGFAFGGPGHPTHYEFLQENVPGADVHLNISYDQFTLVSEYVTAAKSFDINDMSFDGRAAKPHAWDTEAVINFAPYGKPSFFAAGYGRTWDALAINLPEHSIFAVLSSSLVKSTREAIEYRHDINYSSSTTASGGSLVNVFSPTGKSGRDIVTASLKLFF